MSIASPEEILDFWIGDAVSSAEATKEKSKLWFRKSKETDALLRDRFAETVEALANGLAEDWAARCVRARLAAIVALDQFSRNIYRGTPQSFANDARALKLALQAIDIDEHLELPVVEQVFLYLPLEHAEDAEMQKLSVKLFTRLHETAPEAFNDACADWLDYAVRHKKIIDLYGRFPHRNAVLGRQSTIAELDFLTQPGSSF